MRGEAHHAKCEEQPGISAVDQLVLAVLRRCTWAVSWGGGRAVGRVRACLHEVCELRVSRGNESVDLALELVLLVVRVGAIVLGQPRLALSVLQEQVLDHDEPPARDATAVSRAPPLFAGRGWFSPPPPKR